MTLTVHPNWDSSCRSLVSGHVRVTIDLLKQTTLNVQNEIRTIASRNKGTLLQSKWKMSGSASLLDHSSPSKMCTIEKFKSAGATRSSRHILCHKLELVLWFSTRKCQPSTFTVGRRPNHDLISPWSPQLPRFVWNSLANATFTSSHP